MGQLFMYDLYQVRDCKCTAYVLLRCTGYVNLNFHCEYYLQSRHNMEDFDLFNLDDVDAAFDKIIQLKYNQSVPLKGKIYTCKLNI